MSVELTQEKLREYLIYSPETGEFKWRKNRGRARSGGLAGAPDRNKYIRVWIYGQKYLAHRLAWFYMTGTWPDEQIDHCNNI